MIVTVNDQNISQRLDFFLMAIEPNVSRSLIAKNIKEGRVKIDKEVVLKPSAGIHAGQEIDYTFDNTIHMPNHKPIAMDLDIVFEDKNYLVINKPSGISTHPSLSDKAPALLQGVMSYLEKDFLQVGETNRYGLVHRLDKDTSGVIIFAKTNEALWSLNAQFQKREISKEYHAIVKGDMHNLFRSKIKFKGLVLYPKRLEVGLTVWLDRNPRNRLKYMVADEGNGRLSETRIVVGDTSLTNYNLVQLLPKTGRTHQLRVHLSALGYPIVGDKIYNNDSRPQMMLHARSLKFADLDGKTLEFSAEYPEYYQNFLDEKFNKKKNY